MKFVLDEIVYGINEQKIIDAAHTYRVKSKDSLEKKVRKIKTGLDNAVIQEYKYTPPQTQIMDIVGIRGVCYLIDDITIVQAIVKNRFVIDEENSLDKAELLKNDKVGYLSIYYIVSLKEEDIAQNRSELRGLKCEIQNRTVLQHEWAQFWLRITV